MKTLILLTLIFCSPSNILADSVDDGRKQYYGKITSISKEYVIITESCTNIEKSFTWSDDLFIKFSERCSHPGWDMSRSPVTVETNCPQKRVFRFSIKSKSGIAYAEEFSIKEGRLKIVYCNGKGEKDVPADQLYNMIDWVAFSSICESDIPQNFSTL